MARAVIPNHLRFYRKVKLVAEEAVLGVCKNDLGAGPNQSQCLVPQCFNTGS